MSALPPLLTPGPALDADAYRRYSRQILLPEIGADGQRRLLASRVLVIGAGGLGAPVLQYLAAAGIGHLSVVDDDDVDVSNLHRQVIHTTASAGTAKTTSAVAAVSALNPDITVRPLHTRVTSENAREIIAGHDIVVDGTDNFPSRYLIADTCAELGVPEVWGSVLGFDAQVSVFWSRPPQGPAAARTLRDLFPSPPAPGSVPSCAQAGVIGALCGQTGSVMAMEVVKLIVGIGEPLLGRVLVLDALEASSTVLPFARPTSAASGDRPSSLPLAGEDAQACPTPDPGSIDVGSLLQILQENHPTTILLDVREESERRRGAIPGSVWAPLGDLLGGTCDRPLDPDCDVVVYCQSGVRSAVARDFLRDHGWPNARHLTGGIQAWTSAGLELPFPEDFSR